MVFPVFPVAGDAVKCGNRKDVPKLNRRHLYCYMGFDVMNAGTEGFRDVDVWVCVRCGAEDRDRVTKRMRKTLALFNQYKIWR